MKLSVLTVVFNQPKFIEYQYLLLKKYLKNDFEFFVYNNSNNINVSNEIESICNNNNIKFFNVPQDIFRGSNDASNRAGISLDYAIKHNIENYDIEKMIVLDSDMFLIDYFDFDEEVDQDFIGIKQYRSNVYYYTNQLFFAKIKNLPKFDKTIKFPPGSIDGVATDCGGHLYYYFNGHKNITHRDFNYIIRSKTLDEINENLFLNENINLKNYLLEEVSFFDNKKSFSEVYEKKFLHFRAGSNWINMNEKTSKLRQDNLFNFLSYLINK